MEPCRSRPQKHLYSSLEPSEIRLLILHPGRGDDPITCSLKIATLNIKKRNDLEPWSRNTFEIQQRKRSGSAVDKFRALYRGLAQPSYETLSYCWGAEGNYRFVEIDGHSVPVRRNLWWALYHLRHSIPGLKRTLWVDALCINQSDIAERSAQVSIMSSIYSTASGVLIWLGEEADGSTEAIKAIGEVPPKDKRPDWDKTYVPHPLYVKHEEEFVAFCTRPYWGRLWVIQEVCLAARLKIHCGPAFVSWESFRQFWGAFKHLLAEENTEDDAPILLDELMRLSEGGRQPLDSLIRSSRHFECTDPRDRFYGVLGLLKVEEPQREQHDGDPWPVPKFPRVDYSKTPRQLYADIMRWCARAGQVSPFTMLAFSKSLQRALDYPFRDLPAGDYPDLAQKDSLDTFSIYFRSVEFSDHVQTLGPLEYVEFSHPDRSFRWKTRTPEHPAEPRSLDTNLSEAENFRAMLELYQEDETDFDLMNAFREKRLEFEPLGLFRRFQDQNAWWFVGPPDLRLGDYVCRDSMLILRNLPEKEEVEIIGRAVKYDPRIFKMRNTNAEGEFDITKFVPLEGSSLPKENVAFSRTAMKAYLALAEIQILTR